jgi:hypothetical protein
MEIVVKEPESEYIEKSDIFMRNVPVIRNDDENCWFLSRI